MYPVRGKKRKEKKGDDIISFIVPLGFFQARGFTPRMQAVWKKCNWRAFSSSLPPFHFGIIRLQSGLWGVSCSCFRPNAENGR